ARLRDLAATRRYLVDEGLPQRSRATRGTIAGVIHERLAAWQPPAWVCRDLLDLSAADDLANLRLLLLLHTARQNILLYDIVRQVVVPLWRDGVPAINHVDMQRFLDRAAPTHPEIAGWSRATRVKLTGNLLTVLRDYGLLVGTAAKRIAQPVVTPFAAAHLARLLAAEGVEPAHLPAHPDWGLWLLDPARVSPLLAEPTA
ncbi:MAG: BrxA family protein, partial [Chloroflexota bacterium]